MSGTSFTAANQSDLAAALATIASHSAPIGAPLAANVLAWLGATGPSVYGGLGAIPSSAAGRIKSPAATRS